jgi:hypothetical protein
MRRRYPFSNSKARQSLRPRSRGDWRSLLSIFAFLFFTVVFVAGVVYLKHRNQLVRERTWANAVATIEDARPRLVGQLDSPYGGRLLYEVEVLAKYPVDGTMREQWTTLSQLPKTMQEARLQSFLLKGKQCFVRWKPSDPNHIIAEIN